LDDWPLLYLKAHRAEYCDRLTAIRHQGHWEPWLAFFLRGVSVTARVATQTARDIVAMRELHRTAVIKNAKALVLLDALYRQPTVSVNNVAQILSCTFPTAAKLVRDFAARGWLHELTGYERNRLWRYQPADHLARGTIQLMIESNMVREQERSPRGTGPSPARSSAELRMRLRARKRPPTAGRCCRLATT